MGLRECSRITVISYVCSETTPEQAMMLPSRIRSRLGPYLAICYLAHVYSYTDRRHIIA